MPATTGPEGGNTDGVSSALELSDRGEEGSFERPDVRKTIRQKALALGPGEDASLVLELFRKYDKDQSGLLGFEEVLSLTHEINLERHRASFMKTIIYSLSALLVLMAAIGAGTTFTILKLSQEVFIGEGRSMTNSDGAMLQTGRPSISYSLPSRRRLITLLTENEFWWRGEFDLDTKTMIQACAAKDSGHRTAQLTVSDGTGTEFHVDAEVLTTQTEENDMCTCFTDAEGTYENNQTGYDQCFQDGAVEGTIRLDFSSVLGSTTYATYTASSVSGEDRASMTGHECSDGETTYDLESTTATGGCHNFNAVAGATRRRLFGFAAPKRPEGWRRRLTDACQAPGYEQGICVDGMCQCNPSANNPIGDCYAATDVVGMEANCSCFNEDTFVKRANGTSGYEYVRMKKLSAGDYVEVYDERSKRAFMDRLQFNYLPVQTEMSDTYDILLSDGNHEVNLELTDYHLTYANGKYIFASEVQVGDIMFGHDGRELQVQNITPKKAIVASAVPQSIRIVSYGTGDEPAEVGVMALAIDGGHRELAELFSNYSLSSLNSYIFGERVQEPFVANMVNWVLETATSLEWEMWARGSEHAEPSTLRTVFCLVCLYVGDIVGNMIFLVYILVTSWGGVAAALAAAAYYSTAAAEAQSASKSS